MKHLYSFMLCLHLLLAACASSQTPLPTQAPQASVPTTVPLPTSPAATPTQANTPTTAPRPSPTPLPTATATPTAVPPPAEPFTEGMIAILWNPERDQFERVVTYQLDLAFPGPSPDEWTIQTALTGLTSQFMFPSPDSMKLAIAQYEDTNGDGYIPSLRGGDFFNVHVFDLTTNQLTLVTNVPSSNFPQVSWLPDSTAFTYPVDHDIYLVDLVDSTSTRLIDELSGRIREHVWSPDGRWLAIFSLLSDEPMLGSENTRLDLFERENEDLITVASGIGEGDLAWSPDSQLLAFTRETRRGLFILDINDWGLEELVELDHYNVIAAWSPVNQQLTFTDPASATLRLWDGASKESRELFPAIARPVWSPDGSTVALLKYDDERARLLLVDRAEGTIDEIFSVKRVDYALRDELDQFILELEIIAWSPDDQSILFFAEQEEQEEQAGLYVINRVGGTAFSVLQTGLYPFSTAYGNIYTNPSCHHQRWMT